MCPPALSSSSSSPESEDEFFEAAENASPSAASAAVPPALPPSDSAASGPSQSGAAAMLVSAGGNSVAGPSAAIHSPSPQPHASQSGPSQSGKAVVVLAAADPSSMEATAAAERNRAWEKLRGTEDLATRHADPLAVWVHVKLLATLTEMDLNVYFPALSSGEPCLNIVPITAYGLECLYKFKEPWTDREAVAFLIQMLGAPSLAPRRKVTYGMSDADRKFQRTYNKSREPEPCKQCVDGGIHLGPEGAQHFFPTCISWDNELNKHTGCANCLLSDEDCSAGKPVTDPHYKADRRQQLKDRKSEERDKSFGPPAVRQR